MPVAFFKVDIYSGSFFLLFEFTDSSASREDLTLVRTMNSVGRGTMPVALFGFQAGGAL